MAEIAVGTVDELRRSFGGEVSLPGSSSYEEAVRIWNGAVTRRPAVVASCTSAEDVVAALDVARREGLEISVRGVGLILDPKGVFDSRARESATLHA